jgi:diguanylate cyclase (GGDEF)-like protein/PAS domain S-box-containing protein
VAISCSRGGVTVDVNPAFLKLFGYGSVDEVRGNSVLNRIAPQCRAEVQERVRKRAQGLVDESSYESAGLRKDGTQFPLLVSAKNVLLSDGPATFAFLIDFSERKAAEARIQHLAFYDQLTDLANRQLLDDRVRRALAASARSGRHGAMLLIDLDNFKTVNDTLGHVAGDKLLREIAARLSSVVRERDSVARLGGDEFVVLLEALSERQPEAAGQAEAIGEKIRNLLGEPYTIDAKAIRCSCSIGVTLFGHQHMTPEDVVRQADIAMYEAKSEGRNALRFFDPQMQEMINARVLLENELHRALEAEQFAVHFQVQVDHTMLPIGAEALLRWQHPDLGLVSPAYFIPLAEETGLIVPIGQWVLQTACAQLAAWSRDAAMRELVLAINVSSKQFRKPDFPDQVRAALQVHGVDPARLKLELTESMLLDDIEETISKMNALKTLGVKFSLDDFGTGYSSLQYLKRLPLDQLKIDQSFVRDIAVSANDHAIVRTVVAMAHSLNVDVIAEGVETEEQRKLLLACGCLSFQGYLFAKPVPAPRLEDFVQASLAGRRNALAKVPDGTQR